MSQSRRAEILQWFAFLISEILYKTLFSLSALFNRVQNKISFRPSKNAFNIHVMNKHVQLLFKLVYWLIFCFLQEWRECIRLFFPSICMTMDILVSTSYILLLILSFKSKERYVEVLHSLYNISRSFSFSNSVNFSF